MEISGECGENAFSLTLDNLPDDVLLKILESLQFEDLCRCLQVSRKWQFLVQSLYLKEIVINRHLTKEKVHILFNHPFIAKPLESLKYINNNYSTSFNMSDFCMLKSKCPNLKKLSLKKCILHLERGSDFFALLQHISLRMCFVDPYVLFSNRYETKITCLDLSGVSSCFTSEEMRLLPRLKNLHCLYLENCYRINSGGVEWIAEILPQLHVLDLEGTCISDEIIQPILQLGLELRELYLGYNCISDSAFSGIQQTQSLNLRIICVRETNISYEGVEALISLFNSEVCVLNSFKTDLLKNPSNISTHIQPKGCNHYLSHICPTCC